MVDLDMICLGCCSGISPDSPYPICVIDYYFGLILLAAIVLIILVGVPMYIVGKILQYRENRKIDSFVEEVIEKNKDILDEMDD